MQKSDWDFDTLLGIIQGMLDHAEDVRLAAMETLLEIAGQNEGPMSLTPVSVIEYFMFTFNACTKTAQRVFRFLVENSDIPEASEAIEQALLSDVRNEDFEKFVDIVVEATELAKHLKGADLCITGEGRVDFQANLASGSRSPSYRPTRAHSPSPIRPDPSRCCCCFQ